MQIRIKEVETKQDLKTFIYLPEKIHENHLSWLPPLYMDEEKFFSVEKNPAFQHNETKLFLAYRGEKPVGRIMAIVPTEYNHHQAKKNGRFSYFECENNDKEVFDALIHKVEQWLKEKGCTEVIGPMGFSDKEPQGFLISGFDEPTMMITNSSFEFMKHFIEQNHYEPLVELCQYDVPITNDITKRYERFTKRVEERLEIKVHEFTSTKAVKPFVRSVFNLINETYQNIYGFTTVTEAEMHEFANRFLPLLNPRLIKIITNNQGKVIAFVIAMADLSEGIKKAKGRLFPFGWWHILKASKKSKKMVLLLGGIAPDMQNKGVDSVLATRLFKSALNLGFKTVDSHLIMKDNTKMRAEIERLSGHRMYKRYMIYKKDLH